jgi:putative transcriptional regulator
MGQKVINRIKIDLSKKNFSSKWLIEQLNKNETIVFCRSAIDEQPPIKTFVKVFSITRIKTY